MTIVPITQLGQRMVEHGRIRLGVKAQTQSGKTRPSSIDTFRFTSPDQAAIEQLAALYGGTPRPWSDPKASPTNQFEVITSATEIPVWIMPGQLSQAYEMWSGGGCVRRCDGVEVETSQQSYDSDYEPVMAPCICSARGQLECKLKTRMSVVIPTIRFGGAWRVETSGRNAAEEIPAMAEMIEMLQTKGPVNGYLALERRQSQGGRRNFVVPTLRMDVTAQQLMSGAGSVMGQLDVGSAGGAPASPPALGRGDGSAAVAPPPPSPEPWDVDAEVVDAELVDDVHRCRWCGHPVGPGMHEWVDVPNSSEAGTYCAECPDSECLEETIYAMDHAPRDPVELEAHQIEGLLNGTAKWSSKTEGRVIRA